MAIVISIMSAFAFGASDILKKAVQKKIILKKN
jgi:hypothetical protein